MVEGESDIAAINLRATGLRNRGDYSSSSDGIKYLKYFFVVFLAIFASVFFNSINYLSRRLHSVSVTAFAAFLVDTALIVAYPPDLIFPFLISLTTCFTLPQATRKLRQSIVFTIMVLSLVIVLSIEPTVKYSPALLTGSLTHTIAIYPVSILTAFVSTNRIFVRANCFIAGFLVACSVLAVRAAWQFPVFVVLALPTVLLIRRSLRLVLRGQASQEYASWTVILVALISYDPLSTRGFVFLLSLIVGVLLRFSSTVASPVPTERKPIEQPEVPIPLAAMTLTQRRKVVGVQDDDFDKPMSEATTAATSIIIQQPVASKMSTAEIESDEDEIFRRIANT